MDKLLETQETPVNMKQQLDNINNIKNPNHTNNIDNMLNHIVQEKDKLENDLNFILQFLKQRCRFFARFQTVCKLL